MPGQVAVMPSPPVDMTADEDMPYAARSSLLAARAGSRFQPPCRSRRQQGHGQLSAPHQGC
eukprot:627335-Rhodomonas_salina.1